MTHPFPTFFSQSNVRKGPSTLWYMFHSSNLYLRSHNLNDKLTLSTKEEQDQQVTFFKKTEKESDKTEYIFQDIKPHKSMYISNISQVSENYFLQRTVKILIRYAQPGQNCHYHI